MSEVILFGLGHVEPVSLLTSLFLAKLIPVRTGAHCEKLTTGRLELDVNSEGESSASTSTQSGQDLLYSSTW